MTITTKIIVPATTGTTRFVFIRTAIVWEGYSDDAHAACGKAWYCNDNVSVEGWSENDLDPAKVHCGCNNICYRTAGISENGGHGGWKQWECCDDEEDKDMQMDEQEKMLRGAEEEISKSE